MGQALQALLASTKQAQSAPRRTEVAPRPQGGGSALQALMAEVKSRPKRTTVDKGVAKDAKRLTTTAADAVKRAKPGRKSELRKLLEQVQEGKKSDSPGGILGLIKRIPVVGDPAVDLITSEPVMKTLSIIDKPRAIVTSAAKELVDLAEGEGASWDDFTSQVGRNIGYGEIVEDVQDANPFLAAIASPLTAVAPNNEVLKAVTGFAGDVALDPLTYLTVGAAPAAKQAVGGVGKLGRSGARYAAGSTARRTLATEIAQEGERLVREGLALSKEHLDDMIRRAGERGVTGLSRAERAAIGAPDLKVRFAGKAIPGSQPIAEAVAGAGARARAAVSKSKIGAAVRGTRVSPEERKLLDEVLTGGPNAADAARVLAANTTGKAKGRAAATVQARKIQRILKPVTKKDGGKTLLQALEGVGDHPSADAVRRWLDETRQLAVDAGVEIGELPNYVPHVLTDEAKSWAVKNMPEIVDDPAKLVGPELTRTLRPGSEFMGEVIKRGTIEEINGIAKRQAGIKFLNDNLNEILPAYAEQIGEAISRQIRGQHLVNLGAAAPIEERVVREMVPNPNANAAQVRDAERAARRLRREQEILQERALRARQGAVDTARRDLGVQAERLAAQGRTEARKLAAMEKAAVAAADRVTSLRDKFDGATLLVEKLRKQAGVGRRTARKTANARLARAERRLAAVKAELEAAEAAHQEARRRLLDATRNTPGEVLPASAVSAAGDVARLGDETAALSSQVDEAAAEVAAQRNVLAQQSGPLENTSPDLVAGQKAAKRAAQRLDNAEENLLAATQALAEMRDVDKVGEINRRIEDINKRLKSIKPLKRTNSAAARLEAARQNFEIIRDVYSNATTVAGRRKAQRVADIELAATIAEYNAALKGIKAAKHEDFVKVMRTPVMWERVVREIEDGFAIIAQNVQAPEWIAEALTVTKKLREPGAATTLLRHWDAFTNVWKTMATLSPGFHIRNAYGGVFNNWLADVEGRSYYQFARAYRAFVKNPENWREVIAQKMGQKNLTLFEQSLEAAAATGWGIYADEVTSALTGRRGPKSVVRASRNVGEHVEGFLRGVHAWDQLAKGRSVGETAESISRWHFNYRDISDFDRAAKRVIPFWVFTSRNLPLQIEAMIRRPQKFNRYLAAQRNIEGMSEDPNEIVPSYFKELGAIRLPFNLPGGESTAYLTPDLPFIRLNEDVSKLSDPTRLLSDANPIIKLVAEHAAGKNLFTDQPYQDDYGEAPIWAKVPGIAQALEATGATKRGLMTDRTQAFIESLVPLAGRGSRLLPTQERYQDRLASSILSTLFGASIRENTPAVQRGELRRRERQMKKLIEELEQLGDIRPKER